MTVYMFNSITSFSINFDSQVRMIHCIYKGVTGYYFPPKIFLSLKIDFVLTNSADPDKMPHKAAFHQDRHCLLRYPFRGRVNEGRLYKNENTVVTCKGLNYLCQYMTVIYQVYVKLYYIGNDINVEIN